MPRYIVSNGRSFLKLEGSKYLRCDSMDKAHIFMDEKSATNVVKNNLKGREYPDFDKWKIMPLENNYILMPSFQKEEDKTLLQVFDDSEALIDEEAKFLIPKFNTKEEDYIWNFYIQMKETIQKVEERMNIVDEEIRLENKRICDLYHAIEFYNVNAVKGYKFYKMLQESLRKRRTLKDEKEKLEIMFSFMEGNKHIKSVLMKLEECKEREINRKYKPRVMDDFFEELEKDYKNIE